ncbi:winged helix-turn-helix transcriptional regulator [Microbacterium hominis]|nr:winged helix-turn-helix transcriptional regulator [Microbacterium hominis]
MDAHDRATSPRVVTRLADADRTAVVSPAALAARLGRWVDSDGSLTASLAAALRALVSSGELRPGDRLPSERALAAAVAVSRGTVVAAYAALADSGVLERRQGSGTRVAGAAIALPARRSQGESLFQAAPASIDLLRAVPRIPPAHDRDRARLRCRPGRRDGRRFRPRGPARGAGAHRATAERRRHADDARAGDRHQRRPAGAEPRDRRARRAGRRRAERGAQLARSRRPGPAAGSARARGADDAGRRRRGCPGGRDRGPAPRPHRPQPPTTTTRPDHGCRRHPVWRSPSSPPVTACASSKTACSRTSPSTESCRCRWRRCGRTRPSSSSTRCRSGRGWACASGGRAPIPC